MQLNRYKKILKINFEVIGVTTSSFLERTDAINTEKDEGKMDNK